MKLRPTSNVTIVVGELEHFATCLFAPDDLVEVRRLPSGRSTWHAASDLTAQTTALLAENENGQDIYIGANPRRTTGGTKAADVALARCLFTDFDHTAPEQAQERWQAVQLPEPTLILHSGHGVHAYWRLAEPLDDLQIWSRFQRDLATALRSDPAVHDPPRIMRLPGLTNHKPPPALARIISADAARVYALTDLAECVPYQEPMTKPTSEGTAIVGSGGLQALSRAAAYALKWPGVAEGGRNTEAVRHAATLTHDFALGDDEALLILRRWNATNKRPLGDDELHRCLQNGRQYGTHEVGAKVSASGVDALAEPAGPSWYSFQEVVHRPEYRHGLVPISTGFRTLDEPLHGGLRPECLYIVGGRTGAAKSTLGLNIARLVALDGHGVLVFRLEESALEAAWRVHAAAAQVPLPVLLDGTDQADPADRARLIDAWGVLADIPLRFSEQRNVYRIGEIAEEHVTNGGKLVIVDQMSHVQVPDAEVGYQQATQASNHLRLLARELHVPVVAVVQVGREAAKKKDRLSCNDLRDSGAIENDATTVLLIDRVHPPEVRRSDADPFTVDVLIAKNRYGNITRDDDDPPLTLRWWPWCARIEDAGGLRLHHA